MSNKRFLHLLRQLRDLEDATGKDLTEQVETIAYDRIIALENAGKSPDEAREAVQTVLNNERLRYPINLEPLVG